MEYRTLGKSGLKVSAVGLGCNNFGLFSDLDASRKVIHKALDLGITFFETSDSYGNGGGSENILGLCLGARRKDIILATKFGKPMGNAEWMKGTSRRYILSAIEASLRRLKTDWIDLYQFHIYDSSTPIEESLSTLDDLITQGKVRYIGCSNFAAWQVVEGAWTSRYHGFNAFVSCLAEYSLLRREAERDFMPALKTLGVGLLPYSPLASGLLTGKYKRNQPMPEGARLTISSHFASQYMTDANWAIVERLDKFCRERGHTLVELAITWLASRPLVASVFAGATKPEQLDVNAHAVDWVLTSEEMTEIDGLARA